MDGDENTTTEALDQKQPDLTQEPATPDLLPPAAVGAEEQVEQAREEPEGLDGDENDDRREFAGDALLTLTQDGVTVSGKVDPVTGEGVRDLMGELAGKLDAKANPPPVPPVGGEPPHDIDPQTSRCRNCGGKEWWCNEGNACVPRQESAPAAEEAEHGSLEGESQE